MKPTCIRPTRSMPWCSTRAIPRRMPTGTQRAVAWACRPGPTRARPSNPNSRLRPVCAPTSPSTPTACPVSTVSSWPPGPSSSPRDARSTSPRSPTTRSSSARATSAPSRRPRPARAIRTAIRPSPDKPARRTTCADRRATTALSAASPAMRSRACAKAPRPASSRDSKTSARTRCAQPSAVRTGRSAIVRPSWFGTRSVTMPRPPTTAPPPAPSRPSSPTNTRRWPRTAAARTRTPCPAGINRRTTPSPTCLTPGGHRPRIVRAAPPASPTSPVTRARTTCTATSSFATTT